MGLTHKTLQDWLNRTDRIHVEIRRWHYVVSDDAPPDNGHIAFDGFLTPVTLLVGQEEISVLGGIYFPDDRLKSFSGHTFFHAGNVRLNEVIDKPDDIFITMDVRLEKHYHNSFWKAFVLGVCSHDRSKINLSVNVQRPTPADLEELRDSGCEGNRGLAAVQPGSVVLSVGMMNTID